MPRTSPAKGCESIATPGITIKNITTKTDARPALPRAHSNSGARDIHVPRSVSLATSTWQRLDAEAFARRLSLSALVAKSVNNLLRRSSAKNS